MELGVFLDEGFALQEISEIESAGVHRGRIRRWTRVQTRRPSVSMFTFVTPSLAAGRYSSSFTPRGCGRVERTARRDDDARDLVVRHAGTLPCMTMGRPGSLLLDRLDHLEVERLVALEFVGAVARADGRRERVAPALAHEFDGFLGIGQAGVARDRRRCLAIRN